MLHSTMSTHTQRRIQNLNPELEEIRNKVLSDSRVDNQEWIAELARKTSRIHAGFLFQDVKALQDLCLFIGETQNKITDPGWISFGYHLGLNPSVLKVINHNNFNKEDPTYNTLLAFVQYKDATLGKIIQALQNIGRIDVIHRVKNSFNDVSDIVLQHGSNNFSLNNSSESNSDYGSIQMSDERNSTSNESDDSNAVDNNRNYPDNVNVQSPQESQSIIRPLVIPPAPFIFKNIEASPEVTQQRIQKSLQTRSTSAEIQSYGSDFTDNTQPQTEVKLTQINNKAQYEFESIQTSPVANINVQNKVPKKRYSKIIMLTFAQDGEKYVEEICKILRRDRGRQSRIGVLVLNEHAGEVLKDPHRFITGSFHQVDYICPILTESYLSTIRRADKGSNISDMHLDARYAQFIFALMNNYYISNSCLNDKIRCIIPDEVVGRVQENILMSMPIFRAWVKLSEVDDMAVRLLKSVI